MIILVRKDELIKSEDGVHCNIKCRHYNNDERCFLWNVQLIKDSIGPIRCPACHNGEQRYDEKSLEGVKGLSADEVIKLTKQRRGA